MDEAQKRKTYLLLILTTVIWGIQPLCIKWVVTAWTPVTITAVRYYIIGIFLILLAHYRGENLLPPKSCWLGLLGMGITGIGFNNVMQFTGLQYSTVTNCTLIAAASPAITALFAAIFLRERLNYIAWGGIIVSFIGALTVVSHGSIDVVLHFAFNKGDILFFLAQIAWTTYSIIGLGIMKHMSAAKATGWAGICGALVVTTFGLVTDTLHIVPLSLPLTLAYGYTVIFGGIMAMLFWNIGVNNAGPSITSIFQNITPVVGMIGGAMLFQEEVGVLQIMGALAIFVGVYLTTHSKSIVKSN